MKLNELNKLTLGEKIEWLNSRNPYFLVKHKTNENVDLKKTNNGKYLFVTYVFDYAVEDVYEIKDIEINEYNVYVKFDYMYEDGEMYEATETLDFIKRAYVKDLEGIEE